LKAEFLVLVLGLNQRTGGYIGHAVGKYQMLLARSEFHCREMKNQKLRKSEMMEFEGNTMKLEKRRKVNKRISTYLFASNAALGCTTSSPIPTNIFLKTRTSSTGRSFTSLPDGWFTLQPYK